MKVLFVGNPSDRPTDGGGATFQRALLGGLKRMRSSHECSYIQPAPNQGMVQPVVAEKSIDFVWFMSPYHEPVEVPFGTTVWDLGHRQLPWFPELSLSGWTFGLRENYYREVLPRASIVAIGNGTGARSISDFYRIPPENICEIPLPVDLDVLQAAAADSSVIESTGLKSGEYLFYPAQFWPHKNHITLVDALAILRADGSSLKLVFSGSDKGNRAYVESYVNQLGLQEHVGFAGFVDTNILHQLYLNAHALVYASLLGPDNLPPLEAMALGCPVVSAAFAGAREQMGDAALYFDGLDAQDLVSQVRKLDDAALKQRLIANGRTLVQSRTPDEYVKKIIEALDRFAIKRKLWGPSNSYRHPP